MSFGNESAKSIAEKTTERESKNTTMHGGATSAGATSQCLTNQFTVSKQSHRRMIIGGQSGAQGRVSLLGAAGMRRSETTEDSQQCKYHDGTLIMSSLPMLMHSIKQVIAEEEAAEEQDERTTNKESSKAQLKNQTARGNGSSSLKKSSDDTQKQALLTQRSSSIKDEVILRSASRRDSPPP